MAVAPAPYRAAPLEFIRLPEEEARRRSSDFLELMRSRRSVRQFSHEPVPQRYRVRERDWLALEIAYEGRAKRSSRRTQARLAAGPR